MSVRKDDKAKTKARTTQLSYPQFAAITMLIKRRRTWISYQVMDMIQTENSDGFW